MCTVETINQSVFTSYHTPWLIAARWLFMRKPFILLINDLNVIGSLISNPTNNDLKVQKIK
jgi:hypothetical protein